MEGERVSANWGCNVQLVNLKVEHFQEIIIFKPPAKHKFQIFSLLEKSILCVCVCGGGGG